MVGESDIRLERARAVLEGLSVGDAFGERFFLHADVVDGLIEQRAMPAPPWAYTDDTVMALSLVAVLWRHGTIDQDALAASFAERHDPSRGYGPGALRLLRRISEGVDWRVASAELFGNQGSYGNGAAMRVAPLGAYFADDLDLVVTEARRSAEVTHAHHEGIAGAIAVAVAAAWAWRIGEGNGAEELARPRAALRADGRGALANSASRRSQARIAGRPGSWCPRQCLKGLGRGHGGLLPLVCELVPDRLPGGFVVHDKRLGRC
jgi:ADP-ribosylglycohydrolase